MEGCCCDCDCFDVVGAEVTLAIGNRVWRLTDNGWIEALPAFEPIPDVDTELECWADEETILEQLSPTGE